MQRRSATYPAPVGRATAAEIVNIVRAEFMAARALINEYQLLRWTPDGLPHRTSIALWRAVPLEYRATLAHATADVMALGMWHQQRQVYAPHPDLTASLVAATATSKLPGQALRRLPHPNPLIVFSGGLPVTHTDGHPGRLIAVQVSGAHAAHYEGGLMREGFAGTARSQVLAHTTDPEINAFQLTLISEVFSEDHGEAVDLDMCRVTVPLVEEFVLNELIEAIIDGGFQMDPSMEAAPSGLRSYLRTALGYALPHLLYLVSDKLEIERSVNDRPPKAQAKGAVRPKPARINYCGQRLGAAVRAWAYRDEAGRPRSTGNGRTVAPHWRGAHFHSYRVGPGRPNERTEKIVKFLLPFPVNAQHDDGQTITVHPMY